MTITIYKGQLLISNLKIIYCIVMYVLLTDIYVLYENNVKNNMTFARRNILS